MMSMRRRMRRFQILIAIAAAACGGGPGDGGGASSPAPRTVQPGAPGEPSRTVDARRPDRAVRAPMAADVAFMHAMIPHHRQALVMTALVPDRTTRREIRLLAERIEVSQHDEIARMRRWLERRGVDAGADDASDHADHSGHGVPGGADAGQAAHGMASPEELERLADAQGPAFDRLFLELMIRHHEGALRMTRDLLALEGAGQEPELFQLISHIDADQRAEIARMRRMLETLTP